MRVAHARAHRLDVRTSLILNCIRLINHVHLSFRDSLYMIGRPMWRDRILRLKANLVPTRKSVGMYILSIIVEL